MRFRRIGVHALTVLCLAASLSFGGEPTYDGRSLSAWIAELSSGEAERVTRAVQRLEVGKDKVVPVLAGILKSEERAVRRSAVLAFILLIDRSPESHSTVVQHLRTVLATGRSESKRDAARVLGFLGPGASQAIPELVDCLLADDRGVVPAAMGTLEEIGKASVPRLIESVEKADGAALCWIAEVLLSTDVKADAVVEKMLPRLSDKSPETRNATAYGISLFCEASRVSWPVMAKAVASEHVTDDLSYTIIRLAGRAPDHPEAALTLLVDALRSDRHSPLTWKLAAESISSYGERAGVAVPALVKRLEHAELSIRKVAAQTLEPLTCPPSAIPKLTACLDEGDPALARSCAWILAGVGEKGVTLLLAMLKGKDVAHRELAVAGLGNAGKCAKKAVEPLIAVLGDSEPRVRKAAVESLGDLGAAARPAAPRLLEIAREGPDIRLRKAAIESLGEVGDMSDLVMGALRKLADGDDLTLAVAAEKSLSKLRRPR